MHKIISVAENEIGYEEKPPNSNKTKYGKWFGLDGQPWCAMFVSWCYDKAGYPLGKIGFPKGFAGCQTAFNHFTKTGEITKHPVEGDIVLFDWNGDGRYEHTGIYLYSISETRFVTIEGNTSLTNQSNGGMVMRRKRFHSQAVFVHPKVLDK
jgi:hypothetical protein